MQMGVIQTLKAREERLKNVGKIPYNEMRISLNNLENSEGMNLVDNSNLQSSKQIKRNMRNSSIETRASTEPSTNISGKQKKFIFFCINICIINPLKNRSTLIFFYKKKIKDQKSS